MSCLFPLVGFKTGAYTEKGKDDYLIMPHNYGDYISLDTASKYKRICPGAPMVCIDGKSFLCDPTPIPCGKCVGCRLDNARHWKNRLCLEALDYKPDEVYFMTLTYDDAHLPINEDGEPYVEKSHFQNFMKLLRRYHGDYRYFACSEYGSVGHRPHFHAILFGKLDHVAPIGVNQYRSDSIDLCWSKGMKDIKIAEPGCMAYVAGYVEKKQADPYYYSYPVKPFLLMSDRPGIGFSYLQKIDLVHDPHIYGNFGGSHSTTIPPALMRKLQDAPGYDLFKASMKVKGIEKSLQFSNIYNSEYESLVADMREILLTNKIQKGRKDKI